MQSTFKTVAIIALAATAVSDAHAYIDPGTGSALIQGLIAGIALIGVTLRVYWFKIRAFFSPRKQQDDDAQPDDAHDDRA